MFVIIVRNGFIRVLAPMHKRYQARFGPYTKSSILIGIVIEAKCERDTNTHTHIRTPGSLRVARTKMKFNSFIQ